MTRAWPARTTRGVRLVQGILLVALTVLSVESVQAQAVFTVTGPARVSEPSDSGTPSRPHTYTVTRTGSPLTSATVLTWNIAYVTTTPDDFVASSGTVTFAAGSSVRTFIVGIRTDSFAESEERFDLNVSSTGHSSGAALPVTIAANPGAMGRFATIGGADRTVLEGTIIEVPIRMSGQTFQFSSLVTFAITGTATNADYEVVTRTTAPTLSFNTGTGVGIIQLFNNQNEGSIPIRILSDSVMDAGETLVVGITNHTSGSSHTPFDPAPRTYTIATPARTLTLSGPVHAETNADTSIVYTVALTAGDTAFAAPTQVTWTVTHGGTSNDDLGALTGTITFPTQTQFSIPVTGDTLNEADEAFTVTVTVADLLADGGTAPGATTTTIADDDAITVAIGDIPTVYEGATAGFPLTLTGGTRTADVILAYTLSGPGIDAADFTDLTGITGQTFTIPQAATPPYTLSVAIADDGLADEPEELTLTLVGASSMGRVDIKTGGDPNQDATATIRALGPRVVADPTALTVAEGTMTTYTMRLLTQPGGPVTVMPASGDMAIATVAGALTFTVANWNTAQSVTVTGVADANAVTDTVVVSHTVTGYGSAAADEVTVTVADTAGVTIAPTSLTVTEGGTITYTVVLDTEPVGNVTITLNVTPSDHDLMLTRGALTFTPGNWNTAQTVTGVAAEDGDTVDDTATITHTVTGYGAAAAATITIVDNDSGVPSLFTVTGPRRVTEPPASGAASVPYSYTVTRTGAPLTSNTILTWNITYVTTISEDFVASSGTVAFVAGSSISTFPVHIPSDMYAESEERFTLNVSSTDPGHSFGAPLLVIIAANSGTTGRLASLGGADRTVQEGTILQVPIMMAGGMLEFTSSVHYSITGTATNADYEVMTQTNFPVIQFNPGTGTGIIAVGSSAPLRHLPIRILSDSIVESETLIVRITQHNVTDAFDPTPRTYTIVDNARTLTLSGPTAHAETNAFTAIGYTVALVEGDTAFAAPTQVTWTVTHGGTSNDDFGALTGTIMFPTRTQFSIPVAGDTLNEADEAFTVTVSVADLIADGGTAAGVTTTTIVDDDAITVAIGDIPTVYEGTTAGFPLTLTGGTRAADVILAYTLSGPGIDAADFTDLTGITGQTFTIPQAATPPYTLPVAIAADGLADEPEELTLTLVGASSTGRVDIKTGGDPNQDATATIRALGPRVVADPTALTVSEDRGTATYTMRLLTQPDGPVTVTPASGDMAIATVAGALTFTVANWNTAQSVTVTGVADANMVTDTVGISHAVTGYGSAAADEVTVTVADTARITIAPASLTVIEGGSITYTVALGTEPVGEVRITPDVTPSDHDLMLTPGTLTFTASTWNIAQTVTVATAEDGDTVDDTATITHAVTGYGSAAATITIVDNDVSGVPSLFTVTGPRRVTEPPASGVASIPYSYTVTRTGTSLTSNTILTWNIGYVTTTPDDFVASSGTVAFVAGSSISTFPVHIPSDMYAESEERFTVNVSSTDPNHSFGAPLLVVIAANSGTTGRLASLGGADGTVTEDTILQVPITMAGGMLEFTSSVHYSITGTATNADYEVMTQATFPVIQFNPGAGTGTIAVGSSAPLRHLPIRILADPIRESGETLIVRITSHNVTDAFDPTPRTYTIVDRARNLTLSGPTAHAETNADTAIGYVVALVAGDMAFPTPTEVTWTVTHDGTSNDDFGALTGTITFPTQTEFTIPVTGDTLNEAIEAFTVTVTVADPNAAGGTASGATTTTIVDDDAITVAIGDIPTVYEGATAGFPLTLTGGTLAADVILAYTLSGPGIDAADFTDLTGITGQTFTIPQAATPPYTLPVAIAADGLADEPEELTLTLVGASSTGRVDIKTGGDPNQDAMATIRALVPRVVADPTALTVSEDRGTATYTMRLLTQPDGPVTVTPASGDMAIATVAGVLTFTTANWNTAQPLTVTGVADANVVTDTVGISHTVTGYGSAAADEVTVTVVDTARVTIAPASLTVTEGGNITYTVALGTEPVGEVRITPDVTPSDHDLMLTPGTLTFTASTWNIAQTVTVAAAEDGDTVDDTATITHAVTGYGSAAATITIVDNDVSGVTSLFTVTGPGRVTEPPSGAESIPYTFTVTRTGAPLTSNTILTWTIGYITTTPDEFVASSGTVAFVAGSSISTFPVHISSDMYAESEERFTLNVSSTDPGHSFGAPLLVIIAANSGTTGRLASLGGADRTVREDTILQVPITMAGGVLQFSSAVNYSITGTATNADYEVMTQDTVPVIQFNPGTGRGAVQIGTTTPLRHLPIRILSDSIRESGETLIVRITSHNMTDAFDPTPRTYTIVDRARTLTLSGPTTHAETNADTAIGYVVAIGADEMAFSAPTEVTWTVTHGGTGNDDLGALTGTIMFPTQTQFTIPVIGDTLNEAAEAFTVTVAIADFDADGGTSMGSADGVTTTIVDDDDITVAIGDIPTVYEGTTVTFPITLTGGTRAADVILAYTLSGPGIDAADFTDLTGITGQTFTIPQAATPPYTLPVAIAADGLADEPEELTLTLVGASSMGRVDIKTGSDPNQDATTTIRALVPRVVADPTALTVSEDRGTATYTMRLLTQPDGPVTVMPASGDMAIATVAGALTFTVVNWNTAQSVTVTGVEDANMVTDTVGISHTVTGYGSAAADEVTVTVADTDTVRVTIAPTSLTVSEGGSITYRVALDTEPVGDVTITLDVTPSDHDLMPSRGALTFTASTWNTAQTVTVAAAEDGDTVDDTATITHAVTGYGSVTAATITIVDNDFSGVTSLFTVTGPGRVTEPPASGAASIPYTFTVTRIGLPLTSHAVLTWTIAHGDTTDADFMATSGTVVFVAGSSVRTFPVNIAYDAPSENDETFMLTVSSTDPNHSFGAPLSVAIAAHTGTTGRLASLGGADGTVTEDTILQVPITMAGQMLQFSSVVSYSITGTATNADYEVMTRELFPHIIFDPDTGTGTIQLGAQQMTRNLPIRILADSIRESGETLIVTITNHETAGLTVYDSTPRTYTIVDRARTLTLSGPTTHAETNADTAIGYVVALDAGDTAFSAPTQVTWTVTHGGTGNDDLGALTGTIMFPTQTQFTIPVTGDTLNEAAEAFTVTVTIADPAADGGTAIGSVDGVTTTIVDDDDITVAIGDIPTVYEGTTARFPITLTGGTRVADVILAYTLSGPGIDAADFTDLAGITGQTFTIPQAATPPYTLPVAIADDGLADEPEELTLTLTSASSTGRVDITTDGDPNQDATATIVAPGPRVVADPTALTVSEDSGTATYTMRLLTQPDGPVTVMPASGDMAIATVAGALTFTTINWNTAQSVTVTGVEDATAVTDTVGISHTVTGYGSAAADAVTVTVTDADTAGVTIAPASLTVIEDGSITYTVALTSEPVGEVRITPGITPSDHDLTLTPSGALTFTPANWNIEQTVTAVAAGDPDGLTDTAAIGHAVNGADYDAVTAAALPVVIRERVTLGFEQSAYSVSEGAGVVRLCLAVTTRVGGAVEGTFVAEVSTVDGTATSPRDYGSLSGFAVGAGGQSAQAPRLGCFNIALVDNMMVEGNKTFMVGIDGVAGSNTVPDLTIDPDAATATVTIVDDDVFGVAFSQNVLGIVEGTSATYTVMLTDEPAADVTVTPSSSDMAVATVTGALTFTTINWNTAQAVTVTGIMDSDMETSVATITHAVGGDDRIATGSVTVRVADTTATAGVIVPEDVLSVAEGASATYTVVLNAAPDADVTVTPESGDTAVATVTGALIFTTANWFTGQLVTVTGVEDADAVTDTVIISHTVGGYGSVTANDVTVAVTDTDTAGVTIAPANLSVVEGGNITYTVVLNTEPVGEVGITPGIAPSDHDLMLTPGVLTFTPANWNVEQTMTVAASVDADALPDTATISHVVSGADYAAVTAADVTVSIRERVLLGLEQTAYEVSEGVNILNVCVVVTAPATGTVEGVFAVEVSTVDGTATSSLDYAMSSNIIVRGDEDPRRACVPVVIVDDGIDDEGAETFMIQLDGVADANTVPGLTIDPTAVAATITIVDNDFSGVTSLFTVTGPGRVTEPPASGAASLPYSYTVTRTNGPLTSHTVLTWTIAHGDTTDADFVATSGAVAFVAGSSVRTFPVRISNDAMAETEETFMLNVSSTDPNHSFGAPLSVAIAANPGTTGRLASIGGADGTVLEGTTIQVPITMAGQMLQFSSLVNYSITGTATNADYEVTTRDSFPRVSFDPDTGTGSIQLATSHTTRHIPIRILSDSIGESGETLIVTITNHGAAGLSVYDPTPRTYTIADGARTLTLSGPTTHAETNADTAIGYTVALGAGDTALPAPIEVTWTVTHGGTSDDDFGALTGAIMFPTQTQFTIPVTGDTLNEADEAFTVTVAVADPGVDGVTTISSAGGVTTTIADDDDITVAIGNVPTVYEGTTARFPLTLTGGARAAGVILTYTLSGTGIDAADFTDLTGITGQTFTIPQDATPPYTLPVAIADEGVADEPEELTLTLTSASSTGRVTIATGGDPNQDATATIVTLGPRVVADPAVLNVSEDRGMAAYTMRLLTQPGGPVTVLPASGDTAIATVTGALTFTTINWNTAQSVTVTGVEDANAVTDTVGISHTVTGYGSAAADEVTVTVADTDTAGVTIAPASLTVIEGGSIPYTVALATEPVGDVTITPDGTPSDHDLTLTPGALTFTAGNWNIEQTVTVAAAGDPDGLPDTATIIHAVSGADYDAVTAALPVVIRERVTLGFEQSAYSVSRGAGVVGVCLAVTTEVGGAVEGTFAAEVSTVDGTATSPRDYGSRSRVVVFAGGESAEAPRRGCFNIALVNNMAEGSRAFMVRIDGVADLNTVLDLTIDPDAATTTVTIVEVFEVSVSQNVLSVVEGSVATYTVVLTNEPVADVTVTPTSGNTAVATVTGALTFDSSTWNTAQTVTVTATEDDADFADATVTITHAVGSDSGVTADPVVVTVTDNDTDSAPTFSATVTDRTYPADAAIPTLTLPVAADGNGDLSYTLTGDIPAGLTFTHTARTLTGTPTTAAAAVTLTYTATDEDAITATTDAATLTFAVTITSVLAPAVTLAPTALTVTEGSTAIYTVELTTSPAGAVTVTPDVAGAATVSGALTFGPSTWNTAQTVTVTATEDDVDFANATVTISHMVSGYGGVTADPVVVTVTDNDTDSAPTFSATVTDRTYPVDAAIPTLTLPVAADGNGDLSYTLTGDIPAGLTFTHTARTLTGTPTTVAAAVTLTYTATDEDANTAPTDTATLTFAVTITSVLVPAVTLAPTALTVVEGTMTFYTVELTTSPAGAVTVTPDVAGAVTVSGALTFGPSTWNTAQTVTVTATEDDADFANATVTITHMVSGYGDVTSTDPVVVTVTDNDTDSAPAFSATVTDRTYPVDAAIPTLTLPVAAGGNGDLSYTLTGDIPAGLTFTDTARTLTGTPTTIATAVTLTWTVTDEDAITATGDTDMLTFTVTIMLAPAVTLAPTTLTVVEGTMTFYTVELTTSPAGAVTVTPDVAGAVTVSGALTFGPSTWNTAQTVTVTATEDDADFANDTVTISHMVGGYGGVTADTVVVTVTDNDTDSAPTFSATVTDRTYTVAAAIPTLTLPVADGGNGDLSYTLTGDIPDGLTFADTTRTLTGTPTAVAAAVTLTYTATDEDANMDAGDAATLPFAVTITPAPAVTLSTATLSVPEGGIATYTMELTTVPPGDVTVMVSVTPTGDVTTPGALTFSPATWNTARTITVTAADDGDTTDDMATISHAVSGYGSVTTADPVVVTVTDDDAAASVPDFGTAMVDDMTYTAEAAIPTLTLPAATDGNGALNYALTGSLPAGLTFTHTARTLTGTPLTAAPAVTLTYTATDSDAITSAADTDMLTFAVTITTAPAVTIAPTALTVTEGTTTIYTVALTTSPAGDVMVTPTSGNTAVASVTGTLTFDSSTWNTAQTVTVTATEDDADFAGATVTITHAVSGYGGVTTANPVVVTATDNDTDSAPTFSATVTDRTYPVDVAIPTLTLPAADGGNGDLSYTLSGDIPAGLTFTDTARTLTGTPTTVATAVTLTWTATDEDTNMDAGDAATLTFAVTITPVPAVTIAPTALTVVEGTTTIYTVALTTSPAGNVMVTPASGNTAVATVTGALTFGPSTWNTAQTVTVTATEDDADFADATVTITHTVSGYGGVTTANPVVVTATDNDTNSAPTFGATVPDRTYPVDAAIPTLTLPAADGGNGDLSYTLTGDIPDGLIFADTTRTLTGTPTAVAAAVTLTWTATDEDAIRTSGDAATLTFTVTITLALAPAVTIAPTAIAVTEGSTAIYTVALTTSPAGDVMVTPTSGNTAVATVTGALTFDSSTWNTAQTVTVTATEDDADFADATVTITHAVSGYGGVTTANQVVVTATDNDTNSAPTFSATVTDRTYPVDAAIPTLTLPAANGGNGDPSYTLSGDIPDGLTFTDTARTLTGTPTTVAAAVTLTWTATDEDAIRTAADTATLTFAVTITLVPAVTLAPTALTVVEGTTTIYTVALTTSPAGNVMVTPASGNTAVATVTGALTFGPSTWNTAQTVTVTATEDDADFADDTATITHAVSGYGGVTAGPVTVTVTDNAVASPLTFGTASVAARTYTSGTAIPALTLPEATGGIAPLAYSLTGPLPTGLTVDTGTRILSGTPTVAGPTGIYTWMVTDRAATTASLQFTIAVPATTTCSRIPAVRDAIVTAVSGVSTCADVTPDSLSEITDLDIAGMSLSALQSDDFAGLGALTSLDLGDNQLATLPEGVFDGLDALTSLDLGDNQLATLPEGVFDGLDALTSLDLGDNQLATLPTGSFAGLGALTSLDLGNNRLDTLPTGIFDGLDSLTSLTLDGNPGSPFMLDLELERLDNGQFRVRLMEAAPLAIEVTWETVGGGADTTTIAATAEARGTATIAAGERTSAAFGEETSPPPVTRLRNPMFTGVTEDTADDAGSYRGFQLGLDEAAAGVDITPTALTVDEGNTTTYTVVLGTAPSGSVTVTPDVIGGAVTVSGALTFGPTTWNTAQTVTITATDDADNTDDTVTIGHDVSGYTVIAVPNVVVTVTDDDLMVEITPTALTVVEGSTETYTVKLDTAPIGPVTVTPMPSVSGGAVTVTGALTFGPGTWNTAQTVTVTAVEDEDDDNAIAIISHRVSITAFTAPSVEVTVTDDEMRNLGAVNRVVLPEVARALADQRVNAITKRIRQARSDSASAARNVTVGGQSTLAGVVTTYGKTIAQGNFDLKTLLGGSDFVLPLNAREVAPGTGLSALTLWGGGDYRALSGKGDAINWDGNMFSAHLGADARLRDDLLAGVVVSWSEADVDYTDTGSGDYEVGLTSVHPYVGWTALGGKLDVWATAGYGWGELDITPDADTNDQRATSDVTMQTIGAGGSAQVFDGRVATLRIKGEALQTSMDVEGSEDITAVRIGARRLRLGLEASRTHVLAGGVQLVPTLEVGMRHDAGDGRTGTGAEVGGGMRYTDAANGLTVESHGRVLVGHSGDYQDWGIGGAVRLSAGQDGQGLSFSLQPTWGATGSRAAQVWAQEAAATVPASGVAPPRNGQVNMNLGYGLGWDEMLVTPYGNMTLTNGPARTYRLGSQMNLGSQLTLSLEGMRDETAARLVNHGIRLQVGLGSQLTFSVEGSRQQTSAQASADGIKLQIGLDF